MSDAELEAGNKLDAAPPSYESTYQDQPPSYNSLFSDLKKKKKESSGNAEFAQNATQLCCTVVCGSVVGLIILALMTAIPISMIVMGALHLKDCPAERFIPIYLVVGGSFGLFSSLCNLFCRVKDRKEQNDEEAKANPCMSCVSGLVSCFLFAWFIAGNVWVYRTHNEWSPIVGAANYCDPTLYWYAFWLITAGYIVMGVVFVVGICCACCLIRD